MVEPLLNSVDRLVFEWSFQFRGPAAPVLRVLNATISYERRGQAGKAGRLVPGVLHVRAINRRLPIMADDLNSSAELEHAGGNTQVTADPGFFVGVELLHEPRTPRAKFAVAVTMG